MIKIEKIRKQDINQSSQLLTEMWLMHAKSKIVSAQKIKNGSSIKYIRKSLKNKNQVLFVAKEGLKVIGIIRCEIKKAPSFYKKNTEAYIDDLVVLKSYRRKKIASKLVKQCILWAKKKKTTLFTCKIWEFNDASSFLFLKLGFKKEFSHYFLEK